MKVTASAIIFAQMSDVQRTDTMPDDIKIWNAASPDWRTAAAEVSAICRPRYDLH